MKRYALLLGMIFLGMSMHQVWAQGFGWGPVNNRNHSYRPNHAASSNWLGNSANINYHPVFHAPQQHYAPRPVQSRPQAPIRNYQINVRPQPQPRPQRRVTNSWFNRSYAQPNRFSGNMNPQTRVQPNYQTNQQPTYQFGQKAIHVQHLNFSPRRQPVASRPIQRIVSRPKIFNRSSQLITQNPSRFQNLRLKSITRNVHNRVNHFRVVHNALPMQTMNTLNQPRAMNYFSVHAGQVNYSNYSNYSWHRYGNLNYCYYQDQWHHRWFGWVFNRSLYWTMYYNNDWWWYNSQYGWCYWSSGHWWWPNPQNPSVVYIYENGNFYPYNNSNSSVSYTQSLPSSQSSQVFESPDGSRIVRIYGSAQDAFLYDGQNPPTFNPIYLAAHVVNVTFSNPQNGSPLQIIIERQDGSYVMFNAEGQPYSSTAP